MLENLIGYQIIEFKDGYFKVKKNEDIKTFVIEEDYGDCCGYNDVVSTLLIDETELKNNPVITNVVVKKDDTYESDSVKITFLGGHKALAEINSESGSGSGWCYGACVTCNCVETKEEEVITSW